MIKKITIITIIALSTLLARAVETAGTDTLSVTMTEITITGIKQQAEAGNAGATTTVGRDAVERNRLVSVKAVSDMVPNFFIPDYGSRMTSTIYVRGLGARIDQPSIGLNVDNIPILTKENFDFDLMDISRVEMFRGPQSTLYGRNTMVGLMNIYTLSPRNYSGTRAVAEYATGNSIKAGLSHYCKPSASLGLAASAYYTSTSGFYRNLYNGKLCDKERQGAIRLKAEWDPAQGTIVSNTLIIGLSRQGGYPYEYTATGEINYNDTCFYRRTSVLDGLTVTHNFNNVTLSSITSYQYINDNMTLDQDFTPLPYFTLTQKRREHAVTQDVVVRKKRSASRYNWLAGAFGFFKHYNMSAPVSFYDTGISSLIEEHRNSANPDYPIVWDGRSFLLGSDFNCNSWGAALYHNSELQLGKVTLNAGVRIDYERSTLNYHSETHTGYTTMRLADGSIYDHDNIDIDDRGDLTKDFVQVLPQFKAQYSPATSTTLWASVSKGYKAGGFNTQMFSDVLQQRLMGMMGIGARYKVDEIVGYKPEKAWNYEIGMHYTSADNRFSADLSAFYIDCRDRQLTTFPDGTTTGRVMTNAGHTRSAGVEASITTRPLNGFSINASYGYCDARFITYNDGKADYKDKIVPYCPTHTLWCEATYSLSTHRNFIKRVNFAANLRAVGSIMWNEANSISQPFYAKLGSTVSLQGNKFALELWGDNLTDTQYKTFYFVSISHEFVQRGKGRILGATIRIEI